MSARGVLHIVLTMLDSAVVMSLCWFESDKCWTLFWPYPSKLQEQKKRRFYKEPALLEFLENFTAFIERTHAMQAEAEVYKFLLKRSRQQTKEEGMIQIVEKRKNQPKTLDEFTERELSKLIVICENEKHPANQNLLIEDVDGRYSWTNFYLKDGQYRTKHDSIKDAISTRFDKGYVVFGLRNKSELKEAIKTA